MIIGKIFFLVSASLSVDAIVVSTIAVAEVVASGDGRLYDFY